MNKFTPGPWEILGDSTLHINSKATIKGRRICSMPPNTDTETRNNSQLIAAAPEMYEALEKLLDLAVLNSWADLHEFGTALAILNKVKGE